MNKMIKKASSVATGLSLMALAGSASAEVPASVQTAFDAAQADAITVLGIIAGALVAVIAGFWLVSMVKKGRSV